MNFKTGLNIGLISAMFFASSYRPVSAESMYYGQDTSLYSSQVILGETVTYNPTPSQQQMTLSMQQMTYSAPPPMPAYSQMTSNLEGMVALLGLEIEETEDHPVTKAILNFEGEWEGPIKISLARLLAANREPSITVYLMRPQNDYGLIRHSQTAVIRASADNARIEIYDLELWEGEEFKLWIEVATPISSSIDMVETFVLDASLRIDSAMAEKREASWSINRGRFSPK